MFSIISLLLLSYFFSIIPSKCITLTGIYNPTNICICSTKLLFLSWIYISPCWCVDSSWISFNGSNSTWTYFYSVDNVLLLFFGELNFLYLVPWCSCDCRTPASVACQFSSVESSKVEVYLPPHILNHATSHCLSHWSVLCYPLSHRLCSSYSLFSANK